MSEKWAVVIIGADGTPSVCGPFVSEYRATLFANEVETVESGRLAYPSVLESPHDVRAELWPSA